MEETTELISLELKQEFMFFSLLIPKEVYQSLWSLTPTYWLSCSLKISLAADRVLSRWHCSMCFIQDYLIRSKKWLATVEDEWIDLLDNI